VTAFQVIQHAELVSRSTPDVEPSLRPVHRSAPARSWSADHHRHRGQITSIRRRNARRIVGRSYGRRRGGLAGRETHHPAAAVRVAAAGHAEDDKKVGDTAGHGLFQRMVWRERPTDL
jgi:hypothetical protein